MSNMQNWESNKKIGFFDSSVVIGNVFSTFRKLLKMMKIITSWLQDN